MMVSVMCCGCFRFLGADRSVIQTDGLVDSAKILSFPDAESANRLALEDGWSIEDAEGPNHRCPDCRAGQLPEGFTKKAPQAAIERSRKGRGALVPTWLIRRGANS
jgi:hypothetical protein